MKLSIIIPIYNVEDTLQRCLESVLTQMDERIAVSYTHLTLPTN